MNKEQLKKNIEEMEAKLSEMKAELEKKDKFEWKYELWETYLIDEYPLSCDWIGNDKKYLEYGRYRSTEKGAELSFTRNKRANRLEALAEQLGGLKEFVTNEKTWYLLNRGDKWVYSYTLYIYNPEAVYMTEECAKQICDLLNNGEFSLDGEL